MTDAPNKPGYRFTEFQAAELRWLPKQPCLICEAPFDPLRREWHCDPEAHDEFYSFYLRYPTPLRFSQ